MPMYDKKCVACEHVVVDVYEPITIETPDKCLKCGGEMRRVWITGNANSVIGDEIDVSIKHGLCNDDGSPRRFRSREELHRAEKAKGLLNYVVHRGTKGGDRSKHTSKWV